MPEIWKLWLILVNEFTDFLFSLVIVIFVVYYFSCNSYLFLVTALFAAPGGMLLWSPILFASCKCHLQGKCALLISSFTTGAMFAIFGLHATLVPHPLRQLPCH